MSILTDGGALLSIEVPFRLRLADGAEVLIDPAAAFEHAERLTRLLRQRVTRAECDTDGNLLVVVADTAEVTVAPDLQFEAWTFAGARGEQVVCLPGGGLATWGAVP